MNTKTLFLSLVGGAMALSLLSGCATGAASAKYSVKLPPGAQVTKADKVQATISPAAGVQIDGTEKARFSRVVENKVRAAATGGGKARGLLIDVHLSRYEKGSAFARAMLAGLGQIHIYGDVSVYELPARKKLTQFEMNKTFAFGGMYGAAMSIDVVEEGFAEGIAKAVTGKK